MNRFALLLILVAPVAAWAQADAKIPDPDPELERKTFIVPEGFEVNLYAADPLLAKPIQMNFDPQGRLWIASSEVYPQIKPGQKANDKIIVLEDADGDGKADKTTVFADGLLIPTGVEPGDGGAYVANSTELIHLSASKPGGKADKTRVVLSGFGTEDTHHIIHTFRWGPDGCLYVNQSIYIHSHIETPHGVKHLNGGGVWRFRPETMGLDVFVRGFVNTWGHHFDKYGQSLLTDGAYGEGINHGVPGAYFVTAVDAVRIMKGLNPGSPKHCGLEIVSGRHLPDDWQGDAITNDFRGHRVCRFKLSDDGSSFASREMTEVIKSNHPAFRPIDVKMGPDGAIYIADWYNPIIQHGEVDFRDPRRDKTHGRIWRVTAKGRPLVKKPDLVGAKTPDLLDHLKAPEDWTRHQAKRVLKERGAKDVIPALAEWIKAERTEHQLLEALWTYQSLDVVEPALLGKLLVAKEPNVRAAAVRVLTHWQDRIPDALAKLSVAASDDAPRVRLEAVRGLAATGKAEAVAPAFASMKKPVDRTMDYALWLTARDLAPQWMARFQAGENVFNGDVKALGFALEAVGTKDVAKSVRALLDGDKLTREGRIDATALLARVGDGGDVDYLLTPANLDRLAKGGKAADAVTPLLLALEECARTRGVKPTKPATLESVAGYIDFTDERPLHDAAWRLLGRWKAEFLRGEMEARIANEKTAMPQRLVCVESLALLGGPKSISSLVGFARSSELPEAVRVASVVALFDLDLPMAARQTVALLDATKSPEATGPLFTAVLGRKGAAAEVVKALVGKKLNSDVAKVGLRAVRSSTQDAKPLIDALTKAGGLAAARTDWTPAEVKAYVDEVNTKGDAARGELVYRRKDATCLSCHAIAGAGGVVGPDMTSIGASAQVDYLVESLLLPNKAVKEGYHAMRVATNDNKVFVGIKTREAEGKLTLRDAEDKEIVIALDNIDERGQSRSLMPDGLADQLTRQEFVDLVRFLSELGKLGPYAPTKARLIRRWQVIEPTKENIFQFQRNRASFAVDSPDSFAWSSAYAKVSGELPPEALPKLVVWNGSEPFHLIRAQLDVTAAGPIKLKVNNPAGLTLYVGKNPVEVKEETTISLPAGVQTLTFHINSGVRKDGLRVELEDVKDSPARVMVVGGK